MSISHILHLYKITDGAVVGPFEFFVEKAGRQFIALPVIMKAFTALVFSGAWLICAVADLFILLGNTFHCLPPIKICV
ncbi:MAG: hypothetical protein A2X59_03945 [Nitrospirae bacterium GWC2_42_7]|nr:MAG: hypothetical protein A2X59_03945 [Nitrospirae bacterium GWC2_42_7]